VETAEGAIVAKLKLDAGVAALVGTRVHPTTSPQAVALPKLTYQVIDTQRPHSNDGPIGLATARWQFDCRATDLIGAKRLARAVRRCLNGFSGTTSGWEFDSIRVIDEREFPETPQPGTEKPPQRVTLDLSVSYADDSGI
jgi:hypothetical protein